jgi:hypothetical protein
VPTFEDRGSHVVSLTDPYVRILGFIDRSRYFSIKQLLSCTHEAEWTPFQTHYFSENLVAPGSEHLVYCVEFEVLKAMVLTSSIFWDVALLVRRKPTDV